jgi:hypothetical protein
MDFINVKETAKAVRVTEENYHQFINRIKKDKDLRGLAVGKNDELISVDGARFKIINIQDWIICKGDNTYHSVDTETFQKTYKVE